MRGGECEGKKQARHRAFGLTQSCCCAITALFGPDGTGRSQAGTHYPTPLVPTARASHGWRGMNARATTATAALVAIIPQQAGSDNMSAMHNGNSLASNAATAIWHPTVYCKHNQH
jgi:hypothetical protein